MEYETPPRYAARDGRTRRRFEKLHCCRRCRRRERGGILRTKKASLAGSARRLRRARRAEKGMDNEANEGAGSLGVA